MYHAYDNSLYDYLMKGHGVACAEAVQRAFQYLSVPMPDCGEYHDTNDGGALVFLNPFGATIRVIQAFRFHDPAFFSHPHILQPLGTMRAERMLVHVYPGIDCPLRSARDLKVIQEALSHDELKFSDAKLDNGGYLPGKTARFPNGFPVVSDQPGVTTTFARRPARPTSDTDLQAVLYAHLRSAFQSALGQKNNHPFARHFWSVCRRDFENSFLRAAWLEAGQNTAPLAEASRAYEIHLSKDAPVLKIV